MSSVLNAADIVAIAAGARVELSAELLAGVAARRVEVEQALQGRTVYGVTTGLGAQSEQRLTVAQQQAHQASLLLGRSVGGPPWLSRRQARAVLATRLATFLTGDAGVSAQLCSRLADLLNDDVVPAIPATGSGSAGEIIPLAHAFSPLIGAGTILSPGAMPPGIALGFKEGIALLEGVPASNAIAILAAADARQLLDRAVEIAAGTVAVCRAQRDPYAAATARDDPELADILDRFRTVAGAEPEPRSLQAPVSFRASGPVLAHLQRSVGHLDDAIGRALTGVTDSPAYLIADFVGTAGFHGIDLAGSCDALTAAIVHAAEMSAAQLHRLLDPKVTGLPAQLTPRPGPECGMVAVHKRAAGTVHDLRKLAIPASVGSIETSSGQEDLQSFSYQAAVELSRTVDGWREILSCQLLAMWRAWDLAGHAPPANLTPLLDAVSAVVAPIETDRPFGIDIAAIQAVL
jgi:histidine ammonia-lyase